MAILLNGKVARDSLTKELVFSIQKLSYKPHLAIIQIGDKKESNTYIRQKKIFGEKIGAQISHIIFPVDVSLKEVTDKITHLNTDPCVHGIIVQLPLPENFSKSKIIETITPQKDVDGLTSSHIHTPATARGIISLLDFYNIKIDGKKVVVVGRSDLVGKPTALALQKRRAMVTICHSGTLDLVSETKQAEIIVVAVGRPNLITAKHVSGGQVIVDVGINTMEDSKITGDVAFNEVEPIVQSISPVPGGVGPMTVLSLFQNLLDACMIQVE